MTAGQSGRTIRVVEDGQVVAAADVESLEDLDVIRASLHAEAGHSPVGARARLVDAVLDVHETERCHKLEATLPLGDVEALERLRDRCEDVQTRPAGSTCLVDAKLRDSRARRGPC